MHERSWWFIASSSRESLIVNTRQWKKVTKEGEDKKSINITREFESVFPPSMLRTVCNNRIHLHNDLGKTWPCTTFWMPAVFDQPILKSSFVNEQDNTLAFQLKLIWYPKVVYLYGKEKEGNGAHQVKCKRLQRQVFMWIKISLSSKKKASHMKFG